MKILKLYLSEGLVEIVKMKVDKSRDHRVGILNKGIHICMLENNQRCWYF